MLQVEEVRVGLQVGIGLGDREQLAQRALQGLLGDGLAVDIVGRDAGGALSRQILEQAALVAGVALHGLDQVGDEVGAPPQLHVDPAPAFAHHVAQAHQAVEDRDRDDGDHDHNGDDDPFGVHRQATPTCRISKEKPTALPLSEDSGEAFTVAKNVGQARPRRSG